MRVAHSVLLLLTGLMPVLAAAAAQLPPGVRRVLELRDVPESSLSIYVERLDDSETVLGWLEDEPRNPASVAKLLTTLVALDTLGPSYAWKTEAYAMGTIAGEELRGDLLLKGYGDPFLVTERVWQLLRQIRKSGIRKIDGELLIDDSFFDVAEHDPAAFDREPLRAYNVEPNALLTNFKVVRYYIEPEPERSAVRVRLDPELDNLDVINRLALVAGRCRGYQRGVSIVPNDTYDSMIFSGRFPSGCKSYVMDRTALEHNAFTFGLFKSIWRESGGEIAGGWRNTKVPEGMRPFLTFESPPLAEVITKVNKHSNNVMARQLLYTLGAEHFGVPGTEENGRRFIMEWLAQRRLSLGTISVDNGAGLSREARMTAREIAGLLRYGYRSAYMPEFLSSLSLAGLDGTLARRFRSGPITGKAHMKTGSLDHVNAIAGYLQGRNGDRYLVVMLQNHTDVHRGPGEEAQEALIRWLYDR